MLRLTARAAPAVQPVARLAVAAGERAGPDDLRAAAELAARLHLPLHRGEEVALLLVVAGGRLALHEPAARTRLVLDFTPEARRRYLAHAGRDPLIRALGRRGRRVVDATAGLGGDSVHLAWIGERVVAIERHPVVAALLADALARAQAAGVLEPGSIELVEGEATALLGTLRPRPEVVYLDPMFPPKRRASAAARKEMRLLRLLTGDSEDAESLFEAAREAATERVVVKRPDHAPPLVPKPTVSYGGKLVRYDVYRAARTP